MYSKKIMEIFANPTNAGGLQGCEIVYKYENPKTNEVYKIYLKFDEKKEEIIDSRFRTLGNPVAIAVSSVAVNLAIGKQIENLKYISEKDILFVLGDVPKEKEYCLNDIVTCIKESVDDYYKKIEKENKRFGLLKV